MAIARTLKHYLDEHQVRYDTLTHAPTATAIESARVAHIPLHQMAKAVVLEDDDGFVVTVVPSNNRLNLDWVKEELQRDLHLAPEPQLCNLFEDCATGAVPALTEPYGVDSIWDDHLKHVSDVYIEAGDHEHLIHLRGEDFRALVRRMPHSIISASEDYSSWMYE